MESQFTACEARQWATLIFTAMEISQAILDAKAETSYDKEQEAIGVLDFHLRKHGGLGISIDSFDVHDGKYCENDVIKMKLTGPLGINAERKARIQIQWCPMLTEDFYTPTEMFIPDESIEFLFMVQSEDDRRVISIADILTGPDANSTHQRDVQDLIDRAIDISCKILRRVELVDVEKDGIRKTISAFVH